MKKFELPYEEPLFCTYHWMSGAGIPAKQNPTSDIWYYNNTVDWRCCTSFVDDTASELFINLACGSAWTIPFLRIETIPFSFIKCNPIGVIKDILGNGYYINYSGVDEYYVKGLSPYMNHHYFHDGLILGYDDEIDTFTLAAYNDSKRFGKFITPQSDFKRGIDSLYENEVAGGLYAVKADNIPQVLNIPFIVALLKNYLNSDTSLQPPEQTDAVGGVKVYDYYCIFLEKIRNGRSDYISEGSCAMKFAFEHKRCMHNRIKAIEENLNFNSSISGAYAEVVALAENAQLAYTMYKLRHSENTLEQIKSILIKMKKLEIHILQRLILEIDNKGVF